MTLICTDDSLPPMATRISPCRRRDDVLSDRNLPPLIGSVRDVTFTPVTRWFVSVPYVSKPSMCFMPHLCPLTVCTVPRKTWMPTTSLFVRRVTSAVVRACEIHVLRLHLRIAASSDSLQAKHVLPMALTIRFRHSMTLQPLLDVCHLVALLWELPHPGFSNQVRNYKVRWHPKVV